MAIQGEDITFTYTYGGRPVLQGISLDIKAGELVAILGANGSGKSTLVKQFNGLLPLQQGELKVWNLDVSDPKVLWELRRVCGMVFQNPDNQFVSSVVKEDLAFGPLNYQVPEEEIPERIAAALRAVGMEGSEERAPHTLSGGQKQRIALAGVLTMDPDLIIFDEATSMLDPEGRKEVLFYLKQLHDKGKTIIMITHYVEETVDADRIFLMKDGEILRSGSPEDILTDAPLLHQAGLMPPMAVQMYLDLAKTGVHLNRCPLTNDQLVEEIIKYHHGRSSCPLK